MMGVGVAAYIAAGVLWTAGCIVLFCLALHFGFRWEMTCRQCGYIVRSVTQNGAEYNASAHRTICGPVTVERRHGRERAS